jgi:sulfate-transporting ATPase
VSEFIQYIVLGLGLAAIYGLLGSGLVLIYLGSGIVNFAQGTFAMGGAIIFVELRDRDVSVVVALLCVLVAGALFGALIQNTIMRRLRNAAPIARIMATLGLFVSMLAAAGLRYGDSLLPAGHFLPQHDWTVLGIEIQSERVILFAIGLLVVVALTLWKRRSLFGIATAAAAENEEAAANLGWSPNMLATATWSMATALAAVAGALVVPLSGLLVNNLALLIVPTLAAALIGRFTSFGWTFVGATLIGAMQSLISHYSTQPGLSDSLPFLVIIVVLVVTGRSLPLREHVYERLPRVGTGMLRPLPIVAGTVVTVVLFIAVFSDSWTAATTVTLASALLLLSLVVLLGYAGQISLAQGTLAGLGAYVAGRLVATQGFPFWLAFLAAIVCAVPIGIGFSLPALRTRGVNLAVVTLGLGVTVHSMLLSNPDYTGGLTGTVVGETSLFGLDIGVLNHPERYGLFVLALFVIAALAVANLRRSAHGRRLIAIRENERAAASLGVSVTSSKAYAFSIAAVLAAMAGIAMSFRNVSILYESFDPISSISNAAFAVIGGVGYILGPLFGGTLSPGGDASLFNGLLSGIEKYITLIGGLGVIAVLLRNPNGIVETLQHLGEWLARQLRRMRPAGARADRPPSRATQVMRRLMGADAPVRIVALEPGRRLTGGTLELDEMTVRFGGTTALSGVSLRVAPGEVVGLIGPNGAGKTTLIDVVTGFVRGSGRVRVDGRDVTRLSPNRRVQAGIARSWQSLELFEEVTVLENLQIAADREGRRWWHGVTGLLWRRRPELSGFASEAVREFDLQDDLARKPGDLPYGRRRLVGIARAAALAPGILLLDEPAAGLSTAESAELGVLIRRLADAWGMGILLVEHDVDLVMSTCDRVTVLNFGEIIAEGVPEQVRADPAVIAAYLGDEEAEEPSLTAQPTDSTERV